MSGNENPPLEHAAAPYDPHRSRVMRTVAINCWDTEGSLVDCAGTGQDAASRSGRPSPDPRFNDNGDGTVTDRLTNLVWLKDADAFGEVQWEEAISRAKSLCSGHKGLNDGSRAGAWRLANIREMLSLIDYNEANPILPSGHPFDNVRSAIYWSSTSLASAPRLAWMVTLGIGPTVFVVKDTPARMWPVRGESDYVLQTGQDRAWNEKGEEKLVDGSGQDGDLRAGVPLQANRFFDRGDGTVRDNLTGLVWLKNANRFGFKTWSHALACCNGLESGAGGLCDGSKRGDWRLPNIREIESLVDYSRPSLTRDGVPIPPPSLNAPEGIFENVRPSSYWTSTTVASGPAEAMFIILGVGPSIFENKEHQFFVWPVRDSLASERRRG